MISAGKKRDSSRKRKRAPRKLAARLALVVGGLCVGLIAAELVLAALDRPRFRKKHSAPAQFAFVSREGSNRPITHEGYAMYVNKRSSEIRFVYDGDPRGYFGPNNDILHETNAQGFRSRRDFSESKVPGTLRICFLGDSSTFGEGVRFEDTYPEVTAKLLGKEEALAGRLVESYNFGVGGYNTTQSLWLFRRMVPAARPDVVVLGYTLSDAEPPLFVFDEATGHVSRGPWERTLPEGLDVAVPPDTWLYKLRTARLLWQVLKKRERTRRTVAYHRSLYEESSPGWAESRRALRELIGECRRQRIPCCVLCFPVLYKLDDDYPFTEIHSKVRRVVEDAGAVFVDLFAELEGRDAASLWVHPTDRHPNEQAHATAAKALVRALVAREMLSARAAP